MSELDRARDHYLESHRSFEAALPAQTPGWLRDLRRDALGHFEALGLPSRRHEDWKHTSLSALARQRFTPLAPGRMPSREEVEAVASPVFACSLFVFVDGRFHAPLSARAVQSENLRVESLARILQEEPDVARPHLGRHARSKEHAFAALNLAFLEDGAWITIGEGARASTPIHLVFVSTAAGENRVSHPRVVLRAGRESRSTVIQDHVSLGTGSCFTNAVTEVVLESGAKVDLIVLQRETNETFHISNLHVHQERDSHFASHTLTFGGRLVRNDLEAIFADEGATADLRGLFLGTGSQLLDNHTRVDHAMPHCTSRELYKGILAGNARGVFRGRVVVRPDAQQTDAQQSSANILIGAGAEVDTQPQLEIYADDVRCNHGSSIGRLDEEALFYLRTRGIDAGAARSLLTRGFAAEILDALPVASLGDLLGDLLAERLQGTGALT